MLVMRKLCGTMLFTKRNHQSCSRTQAERACSGERQLPDSFSLRQKRTHYWKRAQAVKYSGSYTVLNQSDSTLKQPRCQWQWALVISCNGAPISTGDVNFMPANKTLEPISAAIANRTGPCRHGAKAGSVLINHRSLEPEEMPAALQWRGKCMVMNFGMW